MLVLSPDSWARLPACYSAHRRAGCSSPSPVIQPCPALVDLIVHLEDHDDIAGPRQHGHEVVLAGENGLVFPPGSCSLSVRLWKRQDPELDGGISAILTITT